VTADWVWPNDGTAICPGHSAIYDPDGIERSRSQEMREDRLIVDIPQNKLFIDKGRRFKGSSVLVQELKLGLLSK
jgi:hypothetical protein